MNDANLLSWFSKPVRKAFNRAVADTFDFLVADYGFLGPEVRTLDLTFHSQHLSVRIALEPRDGVFVICGGMVADEYRQIGLDDIYRKCDLGPAQDLRTSAQSTHSLQKSLATHAEALRRILPRLLGPERDQLLGIGRGWRNIERKTPAG